VTRRSHLWLGLALLLVAIRSIPNVTYALGRDQATYGVIGRGLLQGAKLYRDLWDMKPPAIFWVYAGIVKAFGTVMWSIGVVDVLWLLLICWCIFRFAERYLGTAAAVIAVLVEASWHCRMGYVAVAEPETFLIVLVFFSYFQVWREGRWAMPRHFATGLLFGAAFWFKYNALAFLPFLVVVPYLDLSGFDAEPLQVRLTVTWSIWLKRAATTLTGFGVVIAAVLGYFAVAGLWRTLWESHFRMISRYGASPLGDWTTYFLVPLAGTILFIGVLTALAPLAAFLVARQSRELGRLVPILVGAGLGYASTVMQFRFPTSGAEACYPFFAMAWGYLAVKTFGKLRKLEREAAFGRLPLTRVLVWFTLANVALWPVLLDSVSLARRYRGLAVWRANHDWFYANYPEQHKLEHLRGEMEVIHYLRENSSARDTVYIWGAATLIYYLTGLPSPTRFVPNYPLMSSWGLPAWREDLMRDLRRSPPAFIVVARNDSVAPVTLTELDSEQYLKVFPELDSFISRSYRPAATFPDFAVYRRAVM
jgi:hypothetical protein